MKTRIDFVTNSSSSSYIIGTKDSTYTVELVYTMVRRLYIELYENIEKAKAYIDENPECGVTYKEKTWFGSNDRYIEFSLSSGDSWDDNNYPIVQWFDDKFHFCVESEFDVDGNVWFSCETYADYEAYWKEKKESSPKGSYVHGPFTIFSFEDGIVGNWVHWTKDMDDMSATTPKAPIGMDSSLLEWYFPQISYAIENPDDCSKCIRRGRLCNRGYKKECLRLKNQFKSRPLDTDKACLTMLGKICVESESGLLPDPIVDQLYLISEHACEHMG